MLAATLAAASDRAPISITRSENRLVTVVFAGDPDAEAAVNRPQATPQLAAALDVYGGQLTELPGRSLIVTQWGAGSAVDRAERAAQCALTLRAHLPDVSVCVATGRGLVSARVVEGGIIDRGVRMLQRTRPGAIKLDDVSAGMLEARVQVVGQPGGLVLGGDRIEQGAKPRLLGKPTTFLGRTRELSTLESVLTGCVSEPVASAVLVIGAAGTGKSRLRQEFLEKVQLREPVEIVCGWADSLCPGTPFGIIADAVRRDGGHPRRRSSRVQAPEAGAAPLPAPSAAATWRASRPSWASSSARPSPTATTRRCAPPARTPCSWATPCAPRGRPGWRRSAPRTRCSSSSRTCTGATRPACASSTRRCATSASCR